jgi:hypothetical protein
MLTTKQIRDIFIHSNLEGNYDFLEEDLIKLARLFEKDGALQSTLIERQACIDFVRQLNKDVARALEDKRGKGVVVLKAEE